MKKVLFLTSVMNLICCSLALPGLDSRSAVSSKDFIELDFDTEYTPGELRAIYRQQTENHGVGTHNLVTKPIVKDAIVNVAHLMDRKLKYVPVSMQNYTYLIYEAECAHQFVFGHFRVDSTFNGYNVFWRAIKGSNVDEYGFITASGGHGHPIVSTAEYTHRVCLQVKLDHMCSYYHYGVARATVNLSGKAKGLSLDTVQPEEDVKDKPYVIETCLKVPMFGTKRKCPEPDHHKGHCGIPGGIEVSHFP